MFTCTFLKIERKKKVSQDFVIMSEIVRCNWMLQFLHVLKIRKKMSFLFKISKSVIRKYTFKNFTELLTLL